MKKTYLEPANKSVRKINNINNINKINNINRSSNYTRNTNNFKRDTNFFKKNNKKTLLERIINYKSNFKNEIDSYLDPILFRIGSNGALFLAGNEGIKYISNTLSNTDSLESLALAGSYVGLGTAIYYSNKFIINPIAKKIKKIKEKRFYDGTLVGIESWLRTSLQIGGLAGLYFLFSFNNAISNYAINAEKISETISGKKAKKEIFYEELFYKKIQKKEGIYETNALEGETLSGLYTTLTGIEGLVEKTVKIDFNKQMMRMFDIKSRISNNKVIDTEYKKKVEEYLSNEPTRITLEEYIEEANRSVDFIKENIDWDKLSQIKKLNDKQRKLLESIVKSIDGKDLIAYSLTELMPSQTDGKKNMAVMDFLLRNAGREYVELIPALGDNLTSFGPFQFTSYSIYNSNGELRGASIVNLALPENKRIPDSVIKLKGNDHFKAAYLFATENIASLIKELNDKNLVLLESKIFNDKSNIIKYIASAHYKPVYARKSMKAWINNKNSNEFLTNVHPQVRHYAKKTHVNWYALHGLNGKENYFVDNKINYNALGEKLKMEKSNIVDNLTVSNIKKSVNDKKHLLNRNNRSIVNSINESYIDTRRYNSNGLRVFKYIVKQKDNPTSIARNFNEWDNSLGNNYHDVIYTSVVGRDGKNVLNIYPGQEIYVLAKKRL